MLAPRQRPGLRRSGRRALTLNTPLGANVELGAPLPIAADGDAGAGDATASTAGRDHPPALDIGDIYPLGQLRVIIGFETLTGLLMVSWTASFTYFEMSRYWNERDYNGQMEDKICSDVPPNVQDD